MHPVPIEEGCKTARASAVLAQADEIGYDTSSKYYKETERDDLIRISETFAEVRSQLQ